MFRLFLAVCVLGLLPAAASAQSVRVLSSDAEGEQLEFTFAWPRSLAADLDSSGATTFDERALEVLSGGSVNGYHLLDLPTQALPTVLVLASDYDAAPLPLALADSLMPSSARALDVGIARRKPVATLAVPRIGYSGGEVRRYRRVVVDVRYAAPRSASAFARNSRVAVQTTSELSSGTIFRLPIETSGMYRVDAELLQRLGVDPATTDPNNVRVLHNGGRPVPQVVGEDRPIDLVANPVWIRGGGDGGFAGNDAVVFYAQGPQTWQYSGTEWEHTTNPYTRTSFVFLKIGAESERIQSAAFPANGAADRTTTTGRFVVDREEFSWAEEGGSGLQRFSNLFDAGQGIDLAAQADLPGYTGGPVEGGVSFAVRSLGGSPGAEFRLQSGSEVLVPSPPGQHGAGKSASDRGTSQILGDNALVPGSRAARTRRGELDRAASGRRLAAHFLSAYSDGSGRTTAFRHAARRERSAEFCAVGLRCRAAGVGRDRCAAPDASRYPVCGRCVARAALAGCRFAA